MAINFTDFSKAPLNTQESPLSGLFENILKGYKMSKEPAKMQEEQSARELANKLKKLELEHKPKEYMLNDEQKMFANALSKKALEHKDREYNLSDALKQSQINKNKTPGAGKGAAKVNGMVANFVATHPNATQEEITNFADRVAESQLAHTKAVTDRSTDMTSGSSFDKLPTNDKKREIGLMSAMGVDPVEAASLLRKGTSASQYAQDKGIDINDVTPKYALGEQNIKDVQRASAYMDEIDGLDKHITEGLGKYQNKILGYSLEQIADAAEGSNPDQQGRALAARALLPELNALRLKIAGGNIGIEALKELEHKSLGKMNIIESLVDTPTYNAAQKYMREWIEEAGRTRITSLESYGKLKTREQKSAKAESEPASFDFGAYPVSGGR